MAENVGYKLYEESDMPLDEVRQRVEEVLGFVGLDRAHRQDAVGAVRRAAAARGHRPRDVVQAAHPALRRADDRPRSDHGDTIDDEIIKLRDLENVSSIVVTHQLRDAFRIATHEAVREDDSIRIVPADEKKAEEAEFIMLKDGRIHFEGHAAELRQLDAIRT